MKNAIAALALVLTLFAAPAFAEPVADPAKPSKESLLAAWEQSQKNDPYTISLDKTKDQDVYNFETTIFPFKGKVRVLNLLIEKDPAYYHGNFKSYGEDAPGGDYLGVVEAELLGKGKEFTAKHAVSYATWARGNILYFHAKTKKWHTESQWAAYKASLDTTPKQSNCQPQQPQKQESGPTFFSVFLSWFPMLLLIGVWIFFMRSMNKGAVKVGDVYKKSIEWMDKTEKQLDELLQILKQKQ